MTTPMDILATLALPGDSPAPWPPDDAPPAHNDGLATGVLACSLPYLGRHATHVTMREITLPPGGTTGWHYHPGPLLAVVRAGTLTRTFTDWSTETYAEEWCFVENSGPEHAHIGDNLCNSPLVLYAVYFLPGPDAPLSIEAPAPPMSPAPHES
ncbi:cupin domain-containing protein [Streptomyces iconiensis]|uniref:Cupin domain-containing protein n=1 Tax=Streptomyces iconiensis TaxID=1384038 RepID=A0ABT6ZYS3_9ACTN|nr:cupin domain-containing protein [Streptomyces iconiensis]MDJ1134224.1 cupin domain-containing protein [Streptomyces iconiensis]